MEPFDIEAIAGDQGNRYSIVALAAKRAKQIKAGSPPLVETTANNPLTIALQEIAAGKVLFAPPLEEPIADAVEATGAAAEEDDFLASLGITGVSDRAANADAAPSEPGEGDSEPAQALDAHDAADADVSETGGDAAAAEDTGDEGDE